MVAVGHVDQLGCDAETVARSANAALHNCFHVQPFADNAQIGVLPFEGKGRGAGGHVKMLDPRQCIYNFFRDAVSKEFVLRVEAQVGEWEDGHGLLGSAGQS
jgi:hypothetical protein